MNDVAELSHGIHWYKQNNCAAQHSPGYTCVHGRAAMDKPKTMRTTAENNIYHNRAPCATRVRGKRSERKTTTCCRGPEPDEVLRIITVWRPSVDEHEHIIINKICDAWRSTRALRAKCTAYRRFAVVVGNAETLMYYAGNVLAGWKKKGKKKGYQSGGGNVKY